MFNITDKYYNTYDINKTVINCLAQYFYYLGSSRRELGRTYEFFPCLGSKIKNLGTRIISRLFIVRD